MIGWMLGWFLLTSPSKAAPPLTAEQVEEDVRLAKEANERIHPGYTRYTTADDLNDAWQAIIDDGAMTAEELVVRVQRVLAMVRCDHTKTELPKSIADNRKQQPVYLPLTWSAKNGRAFIDHPGATPLEVGDEIVSVDGRPLAAMMDELRPLVPIDGQTHFATDVYMGQSTEQMGGIVDHMGALKWDIPASSTLMVRPRADVRNEQTEPGDLHSITVERIGFTAYKALMNEGQPRNFADSVTLERIGDNAARLRIDSFVNYRNPVKPDRIYAPIFKALKEEKRDVLIVDLRNNGGGSADAKARLFAHLIQEKDRLVRDLRIKTLDHHGLEPSIRTWDKRLVNPNRLGFKKNDDGSYSVRRIFSSDLRVVKPAKYAFDGTVLLLSSETNSSAATSLLAKLQDNGRATVVGEETGGSAEGPTAGVLFFVSLPHSRMRIRVPVLREYANIEHFRPGLGVLPDELVTVSIEDVVQGRDPILDRAKQMIEAR